MRWLVVVSLVVGMGCGGGDGFSELSEVPRDCIAETISQTTCRLWTLQCDCSRDFFGTYDACVSSSNAYLEEQFEAAEAAGLSYAPECGATIVNVYELDIACNLESEITGDPLSAVNQPYCKVFYGTGAEGEPCQSFDQALGDSCAQGLRCLGTCIVQQEPRDPKLEGEECDPQLDVCELGTLCTFVEPQGPEMTTCVRQPTGGEECTSGCDVGFYCDSAEGICKSPPGEGEPCAPFSLTARECADGFYCDDTETCAPVTPAGQPCLGENSRECGAFMECIDQDYGEDDSRLLCGPEQPLICI